MIPTFAGFNMGLSPPESPTISYTAQGQFTITNYNASLTYAVVGATRSSNLLTSVSNGATITAAYASGAPTSAVSTMNVLAHAQVLGNFVTGVTDTGCGPRGNICCPGGLVQPNFAQCGGAPGSLAPDNFCDTGGGAPCPGNCYQLTIACYNWYYTNYTSEGYTLIGNTWGKATNG